MIFTRLEIISYSPQNTSLHTYDNVILVPFKCISRPLWMRFRHFQLNLRDI